MDKLLLSDYSIRNIEFNGVKNFRTFKSNMLSITFEDDLQAKIAYNEFKRIFPVEIYSYGSSVNNNQLLITNYKDDFEISAR